MPARLRPTAPIAADAILVGDPGRALMLAQELLKQPKMSNHARGLWGYGGETAAGHPLTIQSTGMGGPSAAVVLADLAGLGVRRAIRIGTCTSLDNRSRAGELVLVSEAHYLGKADEAVSPSAELTAALESRLEQGARRSTVASLDNLHLPGAERPPAGEVADMQTATLLREGKELNLEIAALLLVTEGPSQGPLAEEAVEAATKRVGTVAAEVLST